MFFLRERPAGYIQLKNTEKESRPARFKGIGIGCNFNYYYYYFIP